MLLRRLAAPSLSRTALRRAAGAPSRAYKAFTETEMPAIIDLFHAYAVPMGPVGRWPTDPVLDYNGLKAVLESIGERPDDATVRNLFIEADTDARCEPAHPPPHAAPPVCSAMVCPLLPPMRPCSGTIELSEFLAAADRILGDAPARSILMIGGPGSGKGVLSARLVAQCGVSHVSCGDMLREEVRRDTPLGRDCDAFMRRGELIPSSAIITLLKRRMREYPGRRLLLDGFPRSRQNAQDFAATCGTPELAISLICPEELMIERILR